MTPKGPKLPSAPRGLSNRARGLWKQILSDYELTGHELALLEEALRSLDRADQARHEVDRDGLTFRDRFGQLRPHPALGIERDLRGLFARTLRELGLDPASLADATRPPRIPGRYD